MSELNVVVRFLQDLLDKQDMIQIYHAKRTYSLADPELPVPKAAAFFKTQLDTLVRESKAWGEQPKNAETNPSPVNV